MNNVQSVLVCLVLRNGYPAVLRRFRMRFVASRVALNQYAHEGDVLAEIEEFQSSIGN